MASVISWIGIAISVIALLLFLGALIYYLINKKTDVWFWLLLIVGIVLTSAVAVINMITTDSYINTLKQEVNTCRQTNPNYVYIPQGQTRVMSPSVAQQHMTQQNMVQQPQYGISTGSQISMSKPQQLLIPSATI